MSKRLWLASVLAGALLLATTSLYANDRVTPSNVVAKAGPVDGRNRTPGEPPVATPTGDDDMPNRTNPGRGGSTPGTIQTSAVIAETHDTGWQRLVAGMRQRWILLSRVWE